MKKIFLKRILLLLSLVVCFFSLCCCSNNSEYEEEDTFKIKKRKMEKSQYPDTAVLDSYEDMTKVADADLIGKNNVVSKKVYITLDSDTYSDENCRLSGIVHNDTNETITDGGWDFQLEIFLDEEWYIVPPTNYCATDLAGDIPPGETTFRFSMDNLDVDYIPGQYRLLRYFWGGGVTYMTYAEFEYE